MDIIPISLHCGSKTNGDKPRPIRRKRRKNRRNLFCRAKQKIKKPAVNAIEANTLTRPFESGTETGKRNAGQSLEAENDKEDQTLDKRTSLHLFDHDSSIEENGTDAIHTSTPVKVTVGGQSDLMHAGAEIVEMNESDTSEIHLHQEVQSKINEADQSIVVEIMEGSLGHIDQELMSEVNEGDQLRMVEIKGDSLNRSGNEEKTSVRVIHTSTPLKVTKGGQADPSFSPSTSLLIDPSLHVEGISRQMTFKNLDSTLSITIVNSSTQPTTPHLKIPTEGNIYSRMEEFKVPVIVDWCNSSLSSSRTPVAENPVYGPEVMPQFSGVSVHLIDTLLKHLKVFLPVSWHPISEREGVSAILHSTSGPKAVQKDVFVDFEQGSVRIGIHGKPLPQDHSIWNEAGRKFPLCSDNVQAFTNRIVKIVNAVHLLKICPGIEATEKNTKTLSGKGHVTFEDNIFGDMDAPCYRTKQCSLLLTLRRKKCVSCAKLAENIDRCEKRAAAKVLKDRNRNSDEPEGIPKTPSRNTRHDYLTDSASKRLLKKKQKQIKLKNQTICRLRARITKLLETEGIDIDAQLSRNLREALENDQLTDVQKIFLQQQIRCSKVKNKKGMRWHPMMIRFALHLKSISPVAYDVVQESGLIRLPCVRTLFDYSSIYKPEIGTNKKILSDVAKKVSELKHSYQRFHTLMFDEITTSQNLAYSKETGELYGYAHLSEVAKEMDELQRLLEGEKELERPPPIAKHMLTYMIKGTASGVKEAVASYPTSNLTKEQLYERTWDVIGNLELVGIAVVALVADGNAVNRAFYQMHVPVTKNDNGIVFDTINFCSGEGRTLYFFNDVPHLLKCIRNNFMSSGKGPKKTRCLMKNGQIITWDTIVRIYNEEKDDTWTFGFKLNKQNVFPDPYSRMRVPLAAQVMSNTVSKLIGMLGYEGCEETAIFIKKVNDFFDMLNGAHSDQEKKTRNANLAKYDSPYDSRFTDLLDFLKYLKDWKDEARAATMHLKNKDDACAARQLSWQTLEGIERSVLAFIGCTRFLLANGQKFVMARVFCQDPLEQYFSRQRCMGGGSRHPNTEAYLRNMNTIHLLGETGFARKRGNTENLSTEHMSLISTPLEKRPKVNTKRSLIEKFPDMFKDV